MHIIENILKSRIRRRNDESAYLNGAYADFPTLRLISRHGESEQVVHATAVLESRHVMHSQAVDVSMERMGIVIRDQRHSDFELSGHFAQHGAVELA